MTTESDQKTCRNCHRLRPITSFRKIKGKYRVNVCNTCRNGSSETMDEKRQRNEGVSRRSLQRHRLTLLEQQTQLEIDRARLFLHLWKANHPFDVCLAKVDEIYPANLTKIPMFRR